MTEAVRRRRSIIRLALDQKDIKEYQLDPVDFALPTWLEVPREVHDAQSGLLKRASIAIDTMGVLRDKRESRYNSLCPETMGLAYHSHKSSVERLLQWKADWNPQDPSLLLSVKIPRDSLNFHLDPHNYAVFTKSYVRQVEVFMHGPYAEWTSYKSYVQHLASRIMDQSRHMEWRHWWDTAFLSAMWKWEVCLEGLIVPTWEEVIDEIYLMVLDRVDDANDLATSISSSRTTSLVNSPEEEEPSAAEYFSSPL